MIVGGARNVSAEQLQRSRAADRQSRGWRVELCEIFREDRQRRSGDPLVEANETLDVSSDSVSLGVGGRPPPPCLRASY